MVLPGLVTLALSIKPGAVYYFEQTHFSSITPHFFVVLNSDPLSSIAIVVVNPTTKIEKRYDYVKRVKIPKETLVLVNPSNCPLLKQESVFDCNGVGTYTPQELIQLCENGDFKLVGEVSNDILLKLREGVKLSPQVEEEVKNYL